MSKSAAYAVGPKAAPAMRASQAQHMETVRFAAWNCNHESVLGEFVPVPQALRSRCDVIHCGIDWHRRLVRYSGERAARIFDLRLAAGGHRRFDLGLRGDSTDAGASPPAATSSAFVCR